MFYNVIFPGGYSIALKFFVKLNIGSICYYWYNFIYRWKVVEFDPEDNTVYVESC